MLYFQKIFKFPNPKQLGMSKHCNAMAMDWDDEEEDDHGEKTWAYYYNYLKKTYPVKFFFASTLPEFIYHTWLKLIGWKLREFKYWFLSFIIRRDHMLDLRQPKRNKQFDVDCYRSGYIDTDTKMIYAMFNLLTNFVEEQLVHMYFPTQEDIAKEPHLQHQLDQNNEIIAIYNWWNKGRKLECKEGDEALTKWHNAKKSKSPYTKILWEELKNIDKRNEDKLEEMLIRLLKIRKYLWS
jgi:hypothetical protein